MDDFQIKTGPGVETVFSNYPHPVRERMLKLRQLIVETARETEGINALEQALKWGEPGFLVKNGSTIRIDWKKKRPGQYAIYFKCTSKLVPAFKKRFGDLFKYEGTRAIIFKTDDELPVAELKQCITAALRYHKVKHLPTLGL